MVGDFGTWVEENSGFVLAAVAGIVAISMMKGKK
jgi:hypothetical protein